MRASRPLLVAVLTAVLVAACESDGSTAERPSTTGSSSRPDAVSSSSTTTTTVPPDPRNARFVLTDVAAVDDPTAMAVRAGDEALYVTEQAGRVRAIRNGALDANPVLDLRDTIAAGGERGLLGLTFSPDGQVLYVDYTNRNGDTRVDAYAMRPDGTADRASRRELLAIDQPQSNHNGGNIVTGPDGMLWVGTGDGGASGDQGSGHAPEGNGQSLDTLLGKLLRIDPTPSGGRPYSVPADNPYATGGGRPEIWAYGLRNPWKFSFDRETGDLVIGDVGQNAYEEVDWVAAGTPPPLNFGWPRREARHEFRSDDASGTVEPILEYPHDGRCSIGGGYVYRGARIRDLVGTYLYSDLCDGRIRGTRVGAGVTAEEIDFGLAANGVVGFGQDHAGELYVLSQGDGVQRIDPA
jgi:glucose/arabinose dehydrogenase